MLLESFYFSYLLQKLFKYGLGINTQRIQTGIVNTITKYSIYSDHLYSKTETANTTSNIFLYLKDHKCFLPLNFNIWTVHLAQTE